MEVSRLFGLKEIIYLNRIAFEQGDRAVLAIIRRQRIEKRHYRFVRFAEGQADAPRTDKNLEYKEAARIGGKL